MILKFNVFTEFRNIFFADSKEVFYIGGAEVLPPPLDAEEESNVIKDLTTEESEQARKKLIEHNLRLVVYIARRFENTGVNLEDLISIGTIGLIKAIGTYRRDKNIKLATYASRCIENEILMHIRKIANQKTEVSLDEPINMDYDGNELLLSDILYSLPDMGSSPWIYTSSILCKKWTAPEYSSRSKPRTVSYFVPQQSKT